MNRPPEVLPGAVSAIRERLLRAVSQSERTILLGTILLASAVSAVTGFVLTQYFSVDVLSSFATLPQDCFFAWGTRIGRHCFSDYAVVVRYAMLPNPWEPYTPYHNSTLGLGLHGLSAGRDGAAHDLWASGEMAARPPTGTVGLSAGSDDRVPDSRGLGGAGRSRSGAGGGVCGIGCRGHSGVDGNRSGQLGGLRGAHRAGVSGGAVPTALEAGGDHGGLGHAGETAVCCAGGRVVRGPAMAVGRPHRGRSRNHQPRRLSAVATGLPDDNPAVDPQHVRRRFLPKPRRPIQHIFREGALLDP